MRPALRNVAIVVAVAALVAFVPAAGHTADFVANLLLATFTIVFILFGIYLYRTFTGDIHGLGERHRAILYGSVAVAVLALAARHRLFDVGGAGVLGFLALIVAASFGLYAVWRHHRTYRI